MLTFSTRVKSEGIEHLSFGTENGKVLVIKSIMEKEMDRDVQLSDSGFLPDKMEVNSEYYVSMNMWGLTPDFMDILEGGFVEFLSSLEPGDIKSEYLLPTIMDGLIKMLVDKGVYKEKLFG